MLVLGVCFVEGRGGETIRVNRSIWVDLIELEGQANKDLSSEWTLGKMHERVLPTVGGRESHHLYNRDYPSSFENLHKSSIHFLPFPVS